MSVDAVNGTTSPSDSAASDVADDAGGLSPASDAAAAASAQDDDPELDFGDVGKFKKSELAKRIKQQKELERGSHEKFEQAAAMRKASDAQLKGFVEALDSDPAKLYKHFGKDFEAVLQREVERRVRDAQMSPEDRARAQEKSELDALKAEKAAWEAEKTARESTAQQQQFEQQFEAAFIPAIEEAGLPRDWATVAEMARYSELFLEQGKEPPLKQIAARVKQDILRRNLSILGAASAEQMDELVPKEVREKWRQGELNRVRSGQPKPVSTQHVGATAPKKPGRMTQSEWNKKFLEL